MTGDVARVDLRDFDSGSPSARAAFVGAFGDSLAATGFVRVAGHAVDADLLDAAYRSAAAVFGLPDDVKQRYDAGATGGARGYVPFGTERAKDADAVDLKEFWHIGRVDGPTDNRWPLEVPAFQRSLTAMFEAMESAAITLLEALAEYLGLARRALADLVVGADSLLRVLRYPPLAGTDTRCAVRAAAHEDINFITLLPAATASGLELMDRSGNWTAIDGGPGEMIVDSGDMLSRFLNGSIPATTHRVVNPDNADSERYSMPFFCQPRPEVLLVPPTDLQRDGEEPSEPPITAGEFHRQRMEEIRLAR